MKIAFISDTHCTHPELPDADLLIHCGDLTGQGSFNGFRQEAEWFHSLRQRYPLGMLYIPGNHDKGLDPVCVRELSAKWMKDPYHTHPPKIKLDEMSEVKEMLRQAGVTLLINEGVTIEGVKIWGCPYTPIFMDWAFMGTESDLLRYWALIPPDTQLLITHGPPKYILDKCRNGNVGSETLALAVKGMTNLKAHAFGHIHEGAGSQTMWEKLFINASVLDGYYNGYNPIPVLDTDTWEIIQWFEDKTL